MLTTVSTCDIIQTIKPDGTTQAARRREGNPPKEGTHQRKKVFLDNRVVM